MFIGLPPPRDRVAVDAHDLRNGDKRVALLLQPNGLAAEVFLVSRVEVYGRRVSSYRQYSILTDQWHSKVLPG